MSPPFPPQFFILLGVDIFLGGSIVAVVFDEDFPTGLPYVLDFSALVGLIQLVLTPQYLTGYPVEVQFYYSVVYAVTANLAILGSNLYLVLVRGRWVAGGAFAVAATVPSVLGTPFFISAYVNDVIVPLPTIPLLPWAFVWGAFFGASALIVGAMVVFTRARRRSLPLRTEPKDAKDRGLP